MRNARVDDNQKEIVEALRAAGATVQSLAKVGNGCPDLLVSYRRQAYLFEVKDGRKPPSARKLTPAERKWHSAWAGFPNLFTVTCPEDALGAIGVLWATMYYPASNVPARFA